MWMVFWLAWPSVEAAHSNPSNPSFTPQWKLNKLVFLCVFAFYQQRLGTETNIYQET